MYVTYINCNVTLLYFTFNSLRYLSKEQKAILLAFAETEKGTDGTVNGLTDTNKGFVYHYLSLFITIITSESTVM